MYDMTINLTKFSTPREEVLPIVKGVGKIHGRKVRGNVEDGWYRVLLGDALKILKKASPLDIDRALTPYKKLRVYALGGEGVPVSFDLFKKRGYAESEIIYFLTAQPFDVISVVRWEDGNLYYYGPDQRYQNSLIREVKEDYTGKRALRDLPGITPEIRFCFMLANLQRESFNIFRSIAETSDVWNISDKSRERINSLFKRDFSHILQQSILRAGGIYKTHRKVNGNSWLVEWEIGGQTIKSTIHSDLRLVSAGYCLSGQDKLHTLSSIINLAKVFQEDQPLYVTRE